MKQTPITIIVCLLLLAVCSCVTLRKCEEKFSRSAVTDTLYMTVSRTVPRDSTILVTKTNVHFDTITTRIVEISKQGRATVTLIREPVNTTVLAECDSVVVVQRVPYQVDVIRTFGVSPWWKWAGIVSGGLLLLALITLWLLSRYQLSRRA